MDPTQMNRVENESPSPEPASTYGVSRRRLLGFLAAAGLGDAVFGRALAALAAGAPRVTPEMIAEAEWISGLELTSEKRRQMLDGLEDLLADYETNRAVHLPNEVPPALHFKPLRDPPVRGPRRDAALLPAGRPPRPSSPEDLAFVPIGVLARLLRTRRLSSVELTKLCLERLERFDPLLHCVITATADLALAAAARADREIAAGRYRGPLHGIPWGAKDLLAVPGHPTTWGAAPYREQRLRQKATVARRLEAAGAVLTAKLSLGALAWGDAWFGGKTRNPWRPEQGSSGSSAGSAAAVAAGLVSFAIGSETWGSIVSPATRCGVTGLRPTFGRVSRHGAMALSWSMDKLGPMARTVEDCALVFHAIEGADGLDPSAVDAPFEWPLGRDPRTVRVGYVRQLFEGDPAAEAPDADAETRERLAEARRFDLASLEVLRALGFELVPVELPSQTPLDSLALILTAEAATAFDELTRSGRDDLLTRQVERAWPNVFRQGQIIPAVEYLRANRLRTLLMREMEEKLGDVEVYVAPSFGGSNLLLTNLTGHPAVVLPNGFHATDGTPSSITFTGRLWGESALLTVAHAYQRATDFHLQRPPLGSADPRQP